MARTASGIEVLKQAKTSVVHAKTADQLRQAQAVLLPLEFGLSLEQTAQAIGVSVGWACQLRRRFIRQGGKAEANRVRPGGRRPQADVAGQEDWKRNSPTPLAKSSTHGRTKDRSA